MPRISSDTENRFRNVARLLAVLVGVLGCTVLVGWATDTELIKRILPGLPSMKANTAVSFMLAGVSLWFMTSTRKGHENFTTFFAAVLLLLAGLSLSQDLFSFNLGIDELIFPDDATSEGRNPGRMSLASAAGFIIAGISLLLLANPRGKNPDIGQALSLVGFTLALISLLGYVSGHPELYQVPPYAPLGLHTTIGFLLLHLGVFCACPASGITATLASGSSGAYVARRLIPLAVLLPSVVGAVFVSSEPFTDSNTAVALAAEAVISGVLLALVIWWTAHKVDQHEYAVLRERSFLQATLACIGDAVLVTDLNGNITFINAIAEQLTGWSSEDARGKPLPFVFDIIDEATRKSVANPIDRVLREGMVVGLSNHTILVAKDGTERPIDDSAAPIFDPNGVLIGAILVFRDITERRRQEHALGLSEKLYRATFESAAVGIAHIALDGKWLRLNPAVSTITGYSSEELRGLSFADITHPDHLEAAKEQARRLAAGERESYTMEKRYIRKDGSIVWVRRSVSTLFDTHNQPMLYISVIEDISDRKMVEAQQQARLSELKKEAQNRDRFLATLGHELRNPLAALASANQLIARRLGDPEIAHRMLATHTEQLTKLVNDLLDVARVSSGKIALNKQQVNLADVVSRAVESAQIALAEKSQSLRIRMPDKLSVEADPARIEQVITNLLINASKFSAESMPITLDVNPEEGQAVIVLQDQGIGLSSEQTEVIFDPFMQVIPGMGGLGLGLALSQNLIELHGGRITVHSEGLGCGSRFEVRFPIGEIAEEPSTEIQAAPQQFSRAVRILIVDDAQDSATALALLLESMGGQVICAFDGNSALQIAGEWQPEVALIDIGLPDISGFRVAHWLRANGSESALLLAVTGFGDQSSHENILDAGFNGRILKPVNLAVLVEHINNHCHS